MFGWHTVVWLFPTAVTIHNIEEGIWLPAFSKQKGYWRTTATVTQVRSTLVAVTIFAWVCALLAEMGNTAGTYLLCTYAAIMLLNVLLPHLIATIALQQYAPGTASALLLNLPVSGRLLWLAISEQRISARTFAWAGPVAAAAALVPLLLYLARRRRQEPGQ